MTFLRSISSLRLSIFSFQIPSVVLYFDLQLLLLSAYRVSNSLQHTRQIAGIAQKNRLACSKIAIETDTFRLKNLSTPLKKLCKKH